ncbi:MAG: alpha/beta fold hydrolase [Deltaproteobacteria bacterium]|nr:alpha/beta fold hydrolase [Deltaproteobacteria bacterium]
MRRAFAQALGSVDRRLRPWIAAVHGHAWTFAPWIEAGMRPLPVPPSKPWSTTVQDEVAGPIQLTGALHQTAEAASDTVVVVVHGMGGDIDSHYVQRAAIAAQACDVDCLRLNLRGADLSGQDFFHAGLTADLEAAIASEALAAYRHVVLMGYSLGGHQVLSLAARGPDPRVAATAAICAPLDLSRGADDIDTPARWPYRYHVLSALKLMLQAVARRGTLPLPTPLAELEQISTIREWDDRLVAPRHGFAGADDYYRQASVAPRMAELRIPTLLWCARHDPMVLSRSVAAALTAAPSALELRWSERGGHVGFPGDVTLGLDAPPGLEAQAIAWLLAHRG